MQSKSIFFFAALSSLALFSDCSEKDPKQNFAAFSNAQNTTQNQPRKISGTPLEEIRPKDADAATQRIFREYGAMFVAGDGVQVPNKFIFKDEAEVESFQTSVPTETATIDGIRIELQTPALNALLEAEREAARLNLRITPRGTLASKRSFQKTVELWNSRLFPALGCWVNRGKISASEAENLKRAAPLEQITKVLEYESKGWFFGKGCSKSIFSSAAAPGASQHNFLLALDIVQFSNPQVRAILARHGWFQTVNSDSTHFTYLGVEESALPALGLKSVTVGGQKFWIPNL